ncbi:NUDIX domain-containing protein [Paenibacillus pasadenensis]|uniref:NUDIX hydrolase n=1 Tax=Paenibacillus pasadenensis TaxID=217090 RepID=UPI00203A8701|nr:NUDIX domain-containing protein [Paenibacillus pasadenensis]MCM3749211.1 NUDIX domain-containing protein [Paenibacillus pasadenensis]
MIAYNIGFVCRRDEVLLLNREFPGWMGCWNGIGGKLESGEALRNSMVREIREEAFLESGQYELQFKGLVTWGADAANFGGMAVYAVRLPEQLDYPTPIKTREGILDWKKRTWVLHPQNQGISSNLPYILRKIDDSEPWHHHCRYTEEKLHEVISVPVDSRLEDRESLNGYAARFLSGLTTAIPIAGAARV